VRRVSVADEVRGSVTGNNGERLAFRIGGQSLGLTTKDLIPVLLLLILGVGGYLRFVSLKDQIASIVLHQEQIQNGLTDNKLKMLEAVHTWQQELQEQTETIRKLLIAHDYNTGREPGDRLPLDAPPPR
jgi:hypothetical protein